MAVTVNCTVSFEMEFIEFGLKQLSKLLVEVGRERRENAATIAMVRSLRPRVGAAAGAIAPGGVRWDDVNLRPGAPHPLRAAFVDFVECWPDVLPCQECREHYPAYGLRQSQEYSARSLVCDCRCSLQTK